eukprot:6198869-Pleurochrysis_carterae.AAC.1
MHLTAAPRRACRQRCPSARRDSCWRSTSTPTRRPQFNRRLGTRHVDLESHSIDSTHLFSHVAAPLLDDGLLWMSLEGVQQIVFDGNALQATYCIQLEDDCLHNKAWRQARVFEFH